MNITQRTLLLSALLVLAACASTSDVIVRQGDGSPQQCATVGWSQPDGSMVSIAEQKVRTDVMAGLKAKGYTEAATDPACRIVAAFTTHESVQSGSSKPSVGIGGGGGSGGSFGGIGISFPIGGSSKELSGTFSLQVVDTAKNQEIWNAMIDGKFSADEMTDDEAAAVVKKVLEKFPAR